MKLVISAVNFTEGGPLTVLLDAVKAAEENFPKWDITVLVNNAGIIRSDRVSVLEFPYAKKSWLIRLYYEWFYFKALSIKLKPEVWLSLHDITPRVVVSRQYVYCHNPTPFSSEKISNQLLDWKFLLFKRFYGCLYGFFIKRNSAVIVQQSWLRKEFKIRYLIPRVIVAHPNNSDSFSPLTSRRNKLPSTFFFPAFPRVFKNFELLGHALEILEEDSFWRGRVLITIDGTENLYSSVIHKKFKHLKSLEFIGLQSPEDIRKRYSKVDALIFPSLLETWGLPITEAKLHNLPILAIDLPYAHEAVGSYNRVSFFSADNPQKLASLILSLHLGRQAFGAAHLDEIEKPYAADWAELFNILLVDDAK